MSETIDVSYGRQIVKEFWQVRSVPLGEPRDIEDGYEPFAVAEGRIWVRRRRSLWKAPDGTFYEQAAR